MKKTMEILGMSFEVIGFEIESSTFSGSTNYLTNLSIYGPLVNVRLTVKSSVLQENKIFRELLATEKNRKELYDYDVIIHCWDNVTMALLFDNEEKKAYFGAAIRNKADKSDVATGVKLATDRALGIIPPIPDSIYSDTMKKEISNFIERHNCGYKVEGFDYVDI